MVAAEAERFALRGHAQVKLMPVTDLADEGAVARLYGGVPQLWASIHLAGGFAMAPVAETRSPDLMDQVDMNFVTAFLCCGAAVTPFAHRRGAAGASSMSRRGRARMAHRRRDGGLRREQGRVAALTVALGEEVAEDGILVNAVAPSIMDTRANREAMPKADHAAWPKVRGVAATILFLASPENKGDARRDCAGYGKSLTLAPRSGERVASAERREPG